MNIVAAGVSPSDSRTLGGESPLEGTESPQGSISNFLMLALSHQSNIEHSEISKTNGIN